MPSKYQELRKTKKGREVDLIEFCNNVKSWYSTLNKTFKWCVEVHDDTPTNWDVCYCNLDVDNENYHKYRGEVHVYKRNGEEGEVIGWLDRTPGDFTVSRELYFIPFYRTQWFINAYEFVSTKNDWRELLRNNFECLRKGVNDANTFTCDGSIIEYQVISRNGKEVLFTCNREINK